MYTRMRRLFMFRSFTNFSLVFLGFSTTGYFVSKSFHSRKFEHPLITEAIRIIGHNPQVVELAGYPLSKEISFNSRAQIKNNECVFTFYVRGPKGKAFVELTGDSKTLAEFENIDEKKIYYVPSFDLGLQMYHSRSKSPEELEKETLTPEQTFWRFDDLYVDIGSQGDYRVVLADEKTPIKFDKVSERKNLRMVKEEADQRNQFKPENEQDIEQMRQYRQQELYRKVGHVRILFFLFTGLAVMGLYTYVKKNKRINIKSSQLHLQSLEIIKKHNYVKSQFGLNPHFNDQLRGQQVIDEAQFETDIIGNHQIGVAYIKGKKNVKTNEWNIESIEVGIKDKDGKVKNKVKVK